MYINNILIKINNVLQIYNVITMMQIIFFIIMDKRQPIYITKPL